ncbi:MAG TPA: TauD/TfdA family dioxygenase [Candidatus Binataceae bacterium]|nr:TauD/TfdA family dioxygenase [Candidatus Binataceae bacterium]
MSAPKSSLNSEFVISPIAGKIGAEVSGLRLGAELDSATIEKIRQALFRFKVLFFRKQQHLDERALEGFGRLFGELVPHPTIPSLKGTDHILDVDGNTGVRASLWHTDVTFVEDYPQVSILRALVVPSSGGDTVWANTAAAYESLKPPLRALAEELWAVHSNRSDYGGYPTGKPEALKRYHEVFTSTIYETQHPLVRVHPVTGEKTLVLGHFAQRIVGLSAMESAHLLALLQSHITRLENTVRWRWAVGDVAIWDNRATQHSAVDDYGDQPRILRRVTVAGEAPVSVAGKQSFSLRKLEGSKANAAPNASGGHGSGTTASIN